MPAFTKIWFTVTAIIGISWAAFLAWCLYTVVIWLTT